MYSRNERKEMCTAEMCTADTREKERKSKNKSTENDYAIAANLAVKVVLYRTDPFLETLWYYAYANLVHTTFVPKIERNEFTTFTIVCIFSTNFRSFGQRLKSQSSHPTNVVVIPRSS